MDTINLDTTIYSITEIENLMNLKNPYTQEDINNKYSELYNKILSISNINRDKQKNILNFLKNIYNKLNKNILKNNIIIKPNNSNNLYNSDTNLINSNNPQQFLNNIYNNKIKTLSRSINIDSLFRDNYYSTQSSNFSINLPEKINKIISLTVTNMQIPLSFYAVSEYLNNNKFEIMLLDANNEIINNNIYTIHVSNGNYRTQFNKHIDNNFANIVNAINYRINETSLTDLITARIDSVDGKFIFDISQTIFGIHDGNVNCVYINFDTDLDKNITCNSSNKYHQLTNQNIVSKLGWMLGFRKPSYKIEKENNNLTLVSEGICNILGPKYLFLGVNDYQNSGYNYFTASFSDSIMAPNIIGRINIQSILENNGIYNTSTGIYDDDNTNPDNRIREYFGPTDIQKLSFTIYDEFGRIIDFNNMDWSLVVTFKCLYE